MVRVTFVMNRLIRSVAIGGGAAVAVGGSLYLFEQFKLSKGIQEVYLCPEWGFDTRQNVLRGESFNKSPSKQVEFYEKALNSIVSSDTNLRTKSENWLKGYGDLLRALALAKFESQDSDEEVLGAIKAASTIPFGSSDLRAGAASIAYQLTNDPKFLEIDSEMPSIFSSERQLKRWGSLEIDASKVAILAKSYTEALNRLLRLHKAVGTTSDPLCYKASAGGYIAQVLWKLDRKEDARKWLLVSEKEASQCGTPACQGTAQVLKELLARAI